MASVAVQKQAAPKPQAPVRHGPAWEPLRTMRELLRWDPFSEMAPTWTSSEVQTFMPDFEVKETQDAFVFTADMPGVEEKNLEVQLTNNRLTISGKRESEKTEQNATYYATERSYGSFARTFTLPEGVEGDRASAELKSGVLTVTIPKKPEAQPKKVTVTSK